MNKFLPINFLQKSIISCCFFFLIHTGVNAQDPVFWQLSDEEGLPSMTVYKILQDSKGYIWLGTKGGLARFNGNEIQKIDLPASLKNNEIVTLQEDSFGRIWFSNISKQIFYIQQDSIHLFYEKDPADNYVVHEIPYLTDSLLYLAHTAVPYSDSTFKIIKTPLSSINGGLSTTLADTIIYPERLQRWTFIFDEYHKLFFRNNPSGTGRQSASFDQQNKIIAGRFNFDFPNSPSLVISLDEENLLAYSSVANDGYSILPWNQPAETYKLANTIRKVIKIDEEVFFLTSMGLIRCFDPRQELPPPIFTNLTLNDIIKDREENYWIATDNQGVLIVPSFDFKTLELFENASTLTFESPENENIIYSGHNQGKVGIIDNQHRQLIHIQDIPGFNGRITDLILTEKFGLVASSDKGLHFSTNPIQLNFTSHPNGYALKELLTDHDNNLWVAFSAGVRKSDGDYQLTEIRSFPLQLVKRTYALWEDPEHTMWLGTTSGLHYFRNDTVQLFQNKFLKDEIAVTDIVHTPDAALWVATSNLGLLKIKADSIVDIYNKTNHLLTNNCKNLCSDTSGLLWIATDEGLYMHDLSTQNWHHINKFDGLPSNDVISVTTKENNVWVSTSKGLISFSKNSIKLNTTPPIINIENITINENDTTLQDSYLLNYDENSLQINFQGIAFRSRSNIKYRYRLLGLKEDWVETDIRLARFHALEPGNYSFEVAAINEDNVMSEKIAAVNFIISPPWWKTWWFKTLAILSAVLLIGGGIYLRFRN